MAGERQSDLTDRLMSRGAGLQRKQFGGVNVLTGPLATRVLEGVQANAATVPIDGRPQIVVQDGFDPGSNPRDAQLLGHEQWHALNSGGTGGTGAGQHDAEERESQRIEMILQSARDQGASLEQMMGQVSELAASGVSPLDLPMAATAGRLQPGTPEHALAQLFGGGLSEDQIVELLAEYSTTAVRQHRLEEADRRGEAETI
jgi:hypothetical protein